MRIQHIVSPKTLIHATSPDELFDTININGSAYVMVRSEACRSAGFEIKTARQAQAFSDALLVVARKLQEQEMNQEAKDGNGSAR